MLDSQVVHMPGLHTVDKLWMVSGWKHGGLMVAVDGKDYACLEGVNGNQPTEATMQRCIQCNQKRTLDNAGLCHKCWQANEDDTRQAEANDQLYRDAVDTVCGYMND